MTNFYLAREKDGNLYLYADKPEKEKSSWSIKHKAGQDVPGYINLGKEMYPGIKWEDESPMVVSVLFYWSEAEVYDLGDDYNYTVVRQQLCSSKIPDDTGVTVVSGLSETSISSFFVARDKDGSLFLYKGCPRKGKDSWEDGESCFANKDFSYTCFSKSIRLMKLDIDELQPVRWEDEFPTKVGFEIRKIG